MAHEPPLSSSPSSNLIVLMDVLWFQQIILISSSQSMNNITSTSTSSNPLLNLKTTSQTPPISSPSHSSHLDDDNEALDVSSSSDSSPLLPQEIEEEDHEEETMKYKRKRPTRLSLVIASKTRSHSSSPSIHKLPKHMRNYMGSDEQGQDVNINSGLRRSRSCKSLEELEFEEVKGFMDLGFTFKEGQLNPRMMSVIPGLQRLVGSSRTSSIDDDQVIMDDQDQKSSGSNITRPYLSEAWLIKGPDSPLLNLRIPRIKGSSSDVKRQLRSWARNVASAIQLEY